MKNLNVANKLVISFGLILVLFVISVIVVTVNLFKIKTQLNQFHEVSWQVRGAAQDLQADLAEQQKNLYRAIATTDERIITPALADVETYSMKIKEDLAIIDRKALAVNRGIVDNLKSELTEWEALKQLSTGDLNVERRDIQCRSNQFSNCGRICCGK